MDDPVLIESNGRVVDSVRECDQLAVVPPDEYYLVLEQD